MTLDLGGGRRLVLAVGDDGWLWIAAGAVALVLLLALSRAERRLVSRPVGLLLLALRMAAAVALVVALLEPIASRSWTERIEGRLIVGVDLSASMDTADSRRPDAEARLLRNAPGLAPPADDSPPSRRDTASRILDGPALAALSESSDVELIGFARSSAPMDRETLIDLLGRGAPPGPDDDPDALLATDWGPVLDRALAADPDAPVLGVVLLTDGLRNAPPPGSGGADDALADRLAVAGVPVFPVLIGSTVPPRDAAVAAIRAPASSFEGDSAAVFVEVKADGFDPGEPIPVVLEGPGIGPLREVVPAGPDGSRAVASFRVPMERAGTIELVARVEPPGAPDERPENDGRSVAIRVGDEPSRVLLVDAEARWEFRYLVAALDRDRRVDLLPVLLAPPPASGASDATFSTELPPGPGPDQPDPLLDFDAIILGDVPPGMLPSGFWGRLDAFVSEGGGTLVIAPGPRSWPAAFDGNETALALLPVLDPSPVPIDRAALDPRRPALPAGVTVVPEAEAGSSPEAWPMLQFAADPEGSRLAWRGLAPLPWALAGRAKPGATALLVADSSADESDADPIAAAHPYGLGKVLWVGTDGTWRWRLRVGDAYHHRFWGQVIRWASEETAPRGNRLVRFGPDRPRNPAGAPVPLFARFSSDLPGLGRDLTAAARIAPIDDPDAPPLALVPLHPAASRPGSFEAVVPPLPPGRYLATLDAPSLADSFASEGLSPPEADFEVAPEPTAELLALAADPSLLAPLAAATGGLLLADSDAGRLPELLRSRTLDRTRTAEAPLWDTPPALILFFALLTAEWLLRRRAGLP